MKRAVFALVTTIVGLILLLRYETPAPPALATPVTGSTPAGAGTTSAAGAPPETGAGPAPEAARTLVGQTIDTEQGPVQVQVTITGSAATGITISDVTVLQYPNGGGRDTEINSAALPQLVQQALAVQSADIQMVSGATYTSTGFIQSLQSALDQA
ncbi:MAG: FMN-binding protein [Actinomycetota bacterium]|nr:FMN-binding protein [Actinomycetota bacterium]